MNQLEDKLILTKSELQAMLNEAAASGKFKPTVESPLFPTNLLFESEQKHLKKTATAIQIDNGFARYERWGTMPLLHESHLHECVRKLVLSAFLVDANKDVPIEKRIAAKELYTNISTLFLEQLQWTCEEK